MPDTLEWPLAEASLRLALPGEEMGAVPAGMDKLVLVPGRV